MRVFIASPFRGSKRRNERYARAAMLDSLARGEAPYVPHLLYTQVLDDSVAAERAQGIAAALAFLPSCQVLAVYADFGVSEGMNAEMQRARDLGVEVQVRLLAPEALKAIREA